MKNKRKPGFKSNSDRIKDKRYSLSTSLVGFGFSLLMGFGLGTASWAVHNKVDDSLRALVIAADFFSFPGVFMIIFSIFWWMNRKGWGNHTKFLLYKRSVRRRRKYGEKIDPKTIAKSPFEYEKINLGKMNTCLFGYKLSWIFGAVFLTIGIILSFVDKM